MYIMKGFIRLIYTMGRCVGRGSLAVAICTREAETPVAACSMQLFATVVPNGCRMPEGFLESQGSSSVMLEDCRSYAQ